MSHSLNPAPIAYSYVRFSSRQQAEGDSLRRQAEATRAWCERNGLRLDESTTLKDLGKSAFTGAHRQNPDRHALAAFLKLVEAGRVPRDSYLVIENLDRLSREHERAALRLWMDILDAGINIVQLTPETVFRHERSDMMDVMRAVLELSRGHGESAMKSKRIGDAWREKKRLAREATEKKPVTRRCPAWLKVEGGAFAVVTERAATVRLIFDWAVAGYGIRAIVRKLNAAGVPPLGQGPWSRVYVRSILRGRAACGEYQPCFRRGNKATADGAPVPDFYPRVVSDDQWHSAQAAIESRLRKGGRPGRQSVNLFAGLLHDASTGGALWLVDWRRGGKVLMPKRVVNGHPGAESVAFPADVFERAVLARLREIDPAEVLPGNGAAARVLALTGRLADVEGRLAKVQEEMTDGDGDCRPLVEALRKLEDKRAGVAAELAQAQREAASPLATAWGEYTSLVDVLDGAADPEDVRVRLRSALRRTVTGVWCLFVARSPWRFAAAQVHFSGGACRSYLVVSGIKERGRPRDWSCASFAEAGVPEDGLDLRKRAHAAKLARELAKLDPADLAGA
jgi:DNA invertase Pin-like site-specific DNA recombinase